jgi:PAS domain S-box-containing protein
LYAAGGVAWILLSDALVSRVAPNAEWLALAQRYKGIGYVAVTSGALVVLVRIGYLRLFGALERARAGELQVQDLFLRHPRPMWVYDADTLQFVAVNDAAIKHYGYSRQEFLSMSIKDIRPADELPQLMESLERNRQDQAGAGIFRHTRKNGECILVDITSHAVPFKGHRARLVMAQDVTQEALSREAVDRQERQFRQLHDSLQEALWLSSADEQRMLYVSPAFEKIYGRPSEELVRDPSLWLKAVHEEEKAVALQGQSELRRTGRSEREYRIERPDGALRWVRDRRRNIVGTDGAVLMVGGMVEDVTEAKVTELALHELNEQLEARVAARTEELRFVNQELDAFTRTAAHDLKSPLNAISGFTQILRFRYKTALGADGDRMAEQIETSADAMAQLINDLMALSRVTTHDLHLVPVDIASVVQSVISKLQTAEPHREVKVLVAQRLPVRADEGLTRSLMTNLLGNAWKYTGKRDNALIEVGCAESGGAPVFFVRDNGVGFDIRNAEKLFKPFQRFHSAAEFDGTGVGLATCQRIVRRHGGSIWVSSTLGEGTSVFFSLSPSSEGAQHPAIPKDSFFATFA